MSGTNRTYLQNFEMMLRIHVQGTMMATFSAPHGLSSYETNNEIANSISTYDTKMRDIYAQDYLKCQQC
jgi:hypothetical protein